MIFCRITLKESVLPKLQVRDPPPFSCLTILLSLPISKLTLHFMLDVSALLPSTFPVPTDVGLVLVVLMTAALVDVGRTLAFTTCASRLPHFVQ
jgi:hypothetical protein